MKKITAAAVTTALGTGLVIATTPPAHAATSLQSRVLSTAAAQKGDPYRWGAAGPSAFDCSGLVQYSYKKAGKTVPRVAQSQYNSSKHIYWKNRKRGDIVAIGTSSSRIVHIGIFAGYWSGKSWYWHAPKPGQTVRLAPINSSLWRGAHTYYGTFS